MPQLPVAKGAKRLSLPMRLLKSIRLSPSFNRLMTLVILFNCASFVLDGREVSANLQRFMEVSNFACLIIFTIEILICACADGIKEYLRVSWNIFDVIVVGLSWIFDSLSGDSGFSVFRVMRILKPLRLLKRIGSLQDLLEMYGLSARAFASLFLVLFHFFAAFRYRRHTAVCQPNEHPSRLHQSHLRQRQRRLLCSCLPRSVDIICLSQFPAALGLSPFRGWKLVGLTMQKFYVPVQRCSCS